MAFTRTMVALLYLSAAAYVTHGAVTPSIMKPIKGDTTEAALIIVPGASIKGEAYRPLATKIQQTSPLKLWVVLLEGFLLTTPNPLELNGAIDSAIAELKHQGMTANNVFVAGHSLGGVFVGQYGKSHANKLKGILLYASYLTRDVQLSSFPLPVLTISGDLDGQTRITRIVDVFQQLEASLAQKSNNNKRYPVIVMPGVSHAQFASGEMPKAVRDKDLKPEATSEAAYQMIANHTSDFLVATLAHSVPLALVHKALPALDKAYKDTKAIMQISNEILDEVSFLASKPQIQGSGGSYVVQTFAHLAYNSNPLDISTSPSAPRVLSFKMKSYEAIKNALPAATTFNTSAASLTCKDMNQAAFKLALQSASPVARRRYQSHGRPVFYSDDVSHSTGLGWSTSDIKLYEDDQGLHVTSQTLKTSLHELFDEFSGMHYCKGLSPYRAMEWIYVDSLRSHA